MSTQLDRTARFQLAQLERAALIDSIPAAKAKALQRLLAEGYVGVAFQSIWDLKHGGLLAFEALTRPAAKYGFTGPQEAFDIAEHLGHAVQLEGLSAWTSQ